MLGFASKPSPARLAVTAGIVLLTTLAAGAAEKRYGPGVSDSEIKLGQTLPYNGPASVGLTEAAYIKMLNEQDGINGRKIALISLDDGYSPPKTVE
jgi:branched-chain amino acid transport system substrate-binding protein